jgi:hypothetical protein
VTDATDMNRPGLRFKNDFQFFDHSRSHTWRSFRVGDVVDDPAEMQWLTAIGAPVEPAVFRR